jgi:hypothetical protein
MHHEQQDDISSERNQLKNILFLVKYNHLYKIYLILDKKYGEDY